MDIGFVKRVIFTSIGRKFVMAVTGLALGAFMLVHLAENLLLFYGEKAYNGWVDLLLSNPFIIYAELGLAAVFLLHIVTAVWVRWEDWRNAPAGYEERKWQGGRTIGSATMLYTAAAVLAYLVYHLIDFRFADHSMGFYAMVTGAFRDPVFVGVYIAGSLALALHLSHGMQSAFQTLGVNHPKYTPFIKIGGLLVALTMVGFAMISVYFLLELDHKKVEHHYQVAATEAR
ncbi:MAG TPA: succinate dehydrogenase cytochrome b subunit [Elusimicrobiales bacterium]|nr:succinate dehydrogenase cytochrome b subunit [Elusimicrobiales bacterium]